MSEFEDVISRGGIVLFPSDTVYGLACDPENRDAIERLYALKGREPDKSAAVMFFDLDAALAALPELGQRTRTALQVLMPGAVTVIIRNPAHRFPLACREDPDTLGLRVIDVPALKGVAIPVLQSSANASGAAEARTLTEVAPPIPGGAELKIDGGELPGIPSTIVDLREYEEHGFWSVRRRGAVDEDDLERLLQGRFRFDPSSYQSMIIDDLPLYAELQEQVAIAARSGARRILDLGIGTGETTSRLLERHPGATVVGVDESPAMLQAARQLLGDRLIQTQVALLQEPLPEGEFDLVVSALAIHHLDGAEKADLYRRLRAVVAPGGRFVLGDLVLAEGEPVAGPEAFDKPSTIADQVQWLQAAGFSAEVAWSQGDLAVIVGSV